MSCLFISSSFWFWIISGFKQCCSRKIILPSSRIWILGKAYQPFKSCSLNTVLAVDIKGLLEAGKWNFIIAVVYYIITVVFLFLQEIGKELNAMDVSWGDKM